MSGFRPSGDGVTAKFAAEDAELLAGLARQLAALVADRGEPGDDPVLDRLLPDAYRDSPEDAAEFRRFTESELADDKIAGALSLAAAVEPVPGKRSVTVALDSAESVAWLRSLTDIRLALATRIGVNDDGDPTVQGDRTPPAFAVYAWLGAVQESLVSAVDRAVDR